MCKVNIIHDRDNTERLEALNKQIDTQGIKAEFWPSVKGDIAEAHKQIVRVAKLRKEPFIIIGEDDLCFPANDGFEYFMKKVPVAFDVYLGGIYSGIGQLPNEENKITKYFSGLHLYIVAEKFYDKFLTLDTTQDGIDIALGKLAIKGEADIKCCYPFAACQSEFESTNPVCIGAKNPLKYYFTKENLYGYGK